ncbi:MAG: sodium/proline symporter [Phycisphaerae bacterium]|jgi:sodium/proline symporter|nr:sodium/proline symporter [Phycisphaerae bacterium]
MWILSVFVIYLVVLAGIGLYCMRFNRTLEDFVLGGRKMGVWVTAISAQASDMSAWLLVGLPAAAYYTGLSAIWLLVGCTGGIVFNWVVIAPRLRRESERYGSLTIPDYLASRYSGGRVPMVRITAVIIILLGYATYIASQFVAAGKVFATTFSGVDTPWGELSITYHWGMLIGVGIIMLYTVMGGFMAVSWTDLAQGMLMVLTVVVLPLVGIAALGSVAVLGDKLIAFDPDILGVSGTFEKGVGIVSASGAGFWVGVVLGKMSFGPGYPGQPHILVRFMALKDPKKMRQAAIIGITWSVLSMIGAIAVGLVGRAMLGELADKDQVMPSLAMKLMHPGVAGIMIAGAIAAMMSTVDSQLLVAASAVEQDIYIRLFGGKAHGKSAVWIGRITIVALGAAAIPIAWGGSSVLDKVLDAWGILGAGLGPVVTLGLLTKRANRHGAFLGMAAGVSVVYFWGSIAPLIGAQELFATGTIPGFVLNLVLLWSISLITGGSKDQDSALSSSTGGV